MFIILIMLKCYIFSLILSHYTLILRNYACFPNGFLSKSDSCFVHQMALFSYHGRPKISQAVFLSFHKRTHQVWILSGGHTDGRGCKEVSQLSLGPRHLHFRGWEETDQGPLRLTPSSPHFLWKHIVLECVREKLTVAFTFPKSLPQT